MFSGELQPPMYDPPSHQRMHYSSSQQRMHDPPPQQRMHDPPPQQPMYMPQRDNNKILALILMCLVCTFRNPLPCQGHLCQKMELKKSARKMKQKQSKVSKIQQQQQQTTVVINQPGTVMTKPPQRGWNEGLCGCFSDIGTCCFALWCPSFFDCYLATKAGESCCLPECFPFGWLVALRVKHRTSHNIQGSVLGDFCVVSCCYSCAGCQLAREIDKYGN